MRINGIVETIIFRNEANNWTVLLLKVDSDYITAVGDTEEIEVGDELQLEGEEGIHKVYGKQFKFSTYMKILPKSSSSLIKYIADNVEGVGKKTAKRVVEKFGEDTVMVIRFNPANLKEIKGLNDEKIERMTEFFNEEYEKWNCVEYLGDFGISVITASRIFDALGQGTLQAIKQNPYSLLGFIKNLEFKVVDEIGKKQGVPLDSEDRLDAGIVYSLNQITEFGHTCIETNILEDYAANILSVEIDSIKNAITRLKLNNVLYVQLIDDVEFIFRKSYYLAEENIAQSIVEHAKQKYDGIDYTDMIKKISKANGIELSKEQENAIFSSLNNSVSVITGGPGTGKTTIIKCIIEILERMNKKCILCAPTGRAAKRMTQTTGREAKTIHRLLEISKVDDSDLDSIFDIEVKAIEADVVIVDESSMIDTLVMNNLLKAIKINTNIIMVGDIDQLPSVGPGCVLKDIISSDVVNVVYLKQIYRQSFESDIIVNAHRVNSGEYPVFKNKDTDMFFIKTNTSAEVISQICSLVTHRLENFASLDVLKDLQILTPMKKTELGTIELNQILQEVLNKKSNKKNEKKIGEKIFRTGDKVMQIINNYDKVYVQGEESGQGIYNGDIGYIDYVNLLDEKICVDFDGKKVEYAFEELEQLEHSYAITIHKSQGSEFDYVILPIFTGYSKLLTRNLLYTAMTRAKKMLIIVGNVKTVEFMVNNIESKNRKTGLKYKIINMFG